MASRGRRRRGVLLVLLAPPMLAVLGVVGLALTNAQVRAPTAFEQGALWAAPPEALPAPVTLTVVTWNIADAYLFTNNRRERMRGVAAVLRELDPDVVGLQEAFIARDRERLLQALAGTRLVHHVRFPAGTVGNGLWILSAHPIVEAWFHRFAHSNPWWRIGEGDWWAGKGVGLARIALPGGGVLDFFDTHAQAGRGNPHNERVRLGQMGELARFVREANLPTAPAFVLGDFNTRPGRPDYRRAVEEGGLVRAMTLDSRIDHVFSVRNERYRVEVLATRLVAGEVEARRPGLFFSRAPTWSELHAMWFGPAGRTALSDHPGYAVTARITPVTGR